MQYDVIIIGSGLGGLYVGCLLSRYGMSVLLLERQKHLGGCMQSYVRDGYKFDTGLHYVGGLGEGQSLYSDFKDVGLMNLAWKRLDSEGFDRIVIGEKTYNFAEGLENFYETLLREFPKEKEGLREYINMLKTQRGNIDTFSISAYEYLKGVVKSPLLLNVLSGASFKTELNRDIFPLFSFIENNASYIESSWRLKGDGDMLVDTLVKGIEEKGGKVLTDCEVEEIVEENGKISLVRCKNGEEYEGGIFVCDVHPATMCDLVKKSTLMKNPYRKRIASMKNSTGMATISLLMKPNTQTYFNHNFYIYTQDNVWEVNKQRGKIDAVMVSCKVPKNGGVYTDNLDILTPIPWEWVEKWEDTEIGNRGEEYVEFKNSIAQQCVSIAERVIPDVKNNIQSLFVSTPLTWRDYNHTPYGSAYGIRKNAYLGIRSLVSVKTPIPNLFLTGQNLCLHGVHGVIETARRTCNEIISGI